MACDCGKCGGKITGLAHIGIMVKDMEASIRFYRDVLGFELTEQAQVGASKLAFLNIGTCLLELVQAADYAPRPTGVVDHIAIEVTDIENLVCQLTEHRIAFLSDSIATLASLQGGVKNIFFTGPDGERLEFFEHLSK